MNHAACSSDVPENRLCIAPLAVICGSFAEASVAPDVGYPEGPAAACGGDFLLGGFLAAGGRSLSENSSSKKESSRDSSDC